MNMIKKINMALVFMIGCAMATTIIPADKIRSADVQGFMDFAGDMYEFGKKNIVGLATMAGAIWYWKKLKAFSRKALPYAACTIGLAATALGAYGMAKMCNGDSIGDVFKVVIDSGEKTIDTVAPHWEKIVWLLAVAPLVDTGCWVVNKVRHICHC